MSNKSICNECLHRNICRFTEAYGMAESMTRKRLEQTISEEFGAEFSDIVNATVRIDCIEFVEDSVLLAEEPRTIAVPVKGEEG